MTGKDKGGKEVEDCFDAGARCREEARTGTKKSRGRRRPSNALNATQHGSLWRQRQKLLAWVPERQHKESTFGRELERLHGLGQRTWLGREDKSVGSMQVSISKKKTPKKHPSIFAKARGSRMRFRDSWAWAVCRLPHTRLLPRGH